MLNKIFKSLTYLTKWPEKQPRKDQLYSYYFALEQELGRRPSYLDFLWDVDAAIVVDRRGTRDIVTSCVGYESFCDESYGIFIEEVAKSQGLEEWKCTKGESSDTRIWASHGIQSVNLSVGNRNEHIAAETLDTEACFIVR